LVSKEVGRSRGLINGQARSNVPPHNIKEIWKRKRRKALLSYMSVFIVICIILSILLVIGQDNHRTVFRVDNNYQEWSDLMDIGFGYLGVAQSKRGLYLTLQRDGILEGYKNRTEAYMIFLNDKREDYGYNIGYGTFEYYIDIYGYNNSVSGASGYRFDDSKNNSDWNGFMSTYAPFSIDVANTQDQMELSIYPIQFGQTNVSLFENCSLLIYHFDPYGDYEYSRILNIDEIRYNSTVNDETRNEPRLSYYHIFEKNELHIVTRESLAFNNIPYEIRVIQDDKQPVPEQSQPLHPQSNLYSDKDYEERDMTITFRISYEFWDDDIIKECGGVIYESTANATLNDAEMVLYGINRTVVSVMVSGDFGVKYVPEEGVRSSAFTELDFNAIPYVKPRQTVGTDTELEARPTAYYTVGNITIDGFSPFSSHNEWYPSEYYYVNYLHDMDIGVMKDRTYLYVYLRAETDRDNDNADYGQVYFDTDHDATSAPDADDKRIRVYGNDTIAYYEGDGYAWVQTSLPSSWYANAGFSSGAYHGYTFRIPLSDLSTNGSWDERGDKIGFGGCVYDYSGGGNDLWVFYPPDYTTTVTPANDDSLNPSLWADIVYTNYSTSAPGTNATITIDGVLDETAWQTDATYIKVIDTRTMRVYLMMNETYLYYGCMMENDTALSSGDFAQIFFETNNSGDLYPQTSSCGFSLSGDNSTTCYYGTGSGWITKPTPDGAVAKASYTNGNVSYEFQLPLENLTENGKFNNTGDEILFMVMTTDDDIGYTLQYPNYYGGSHDMRYDPQCWGWLKRELIIPEFQDYGSMILFMFIASFIGIHYRGRGG